MAKKKPDGPQKLYRNTGVSELVIEGVSIEPGAEFKATLSPEFEQQMFLGGHLELLSDQSEEADTRQAEEIVRSESAPVIVPAEAEDTSAESSSSRRRGRS